MRVYFWIITFFATIGIITVSTILHELSHYQDVNEYSNNKDICVFSYQAFKDKPLQAKLGYYRYSFSPEDITKDNRIEIYTEIKAYTISFIILGIGIYSLFEIYFFVVDNISSRKSETQV